MVRTEFDVVRAINGYVRSLPPTRLIEKFVWRTVGQVEESAYKGFSSWPISEVFGVLLLKIGPRYRLASRAVKGG